MSNYPDGAENDPDAPWNRKDPTMTEWTFKHTKYCELCGEFRELNEHNVCEKCFIPEEVEEETVSWGKWSKS